jgi:hypothetical protein
MGSAAKAPYSSGVAYAEKEATIQRNGFRSQSTLAEELGLALATVSRFLIGKTVDYATFVEI